MRMVEADGSRRSLAGLFVVVLLLGGWSAWFFFVPVAVYAVTDSARLEVGQTAYPVAAPVSGMIVATHLDLGREVTPGELLVELDSTPLKNSLAEKQAHLAALEKELTPLAAQIAATERAIQDSGSAERARVEESRARIREAEAAQDFARGEAERQKRLRDNGLVPEADVERSKADLAMKKAAAEASKIATARLNSEAKNKESDLLANQSALKRQLATLEGDKATEEAGIATLTSEIDRRQIRAPVTGRIGEIAALQVGSVLKEGDKIAAVIPSGSLKVIADFPPASVFGLIREGQNARLKLDGFPWTQYGDVRAKVTSVASEPRDGRARVELSVDPESNTRIPLQHGLPGVIEIEVDKVPAATLVMRAAGQMMGANRTQQVPGGPPPAGSGG